MSYPLKSEREFLLLLPPAFKCMSANKEDFKSGKCANKNHFYEMVEGEKSPLLVTFGFDLIAPWFFLTVYEVCARINVQNARHS